MKLKQWLYGAAALSMLAACSDHDIAPAGPQPEEGNGYIGVRIQLPTIPSTRANDSFDDGVASEYTINDAYLILLKAEKGESETKARCIGAYELRRSQATADMDKDHEQITTQVARVATVTNLDIKDNEDLYALVVANSRTYEDQDFFMYGDNAFWKNSDNSGKTIQELQETVITDALYSQDIPGKGTASKIVMTNSPFTTVKGGAHDPGTFDSPLPVLVSIKSNVWQSEAEALANPAGVIHIERAVGKVTCSSFNKETAVKVKMEVKKADKEDETEIVEYNLKVDKVYWDIAQEMVSSYLVRNTNRKPVDNPAGDNLWNWNYASEFCTVTSSGDDGPGKYRMIGHTPIISQYYRPYFCQVPGYGVKAEKDGDIYEAKKFNKRIMEAGEAVEWPNDPDHPERSAFYPRENTFPVDYMMYANTTRIGFWVTFKFEEVNNKDKVLDVSGKDFYTRGLDKSTIYLDDEHGNDPLTAAVIKSLSENAKVKEAVDAVVADKNNSGYRDLYLGDLLTFTYKKPGDKDYVDDGGIVISSVEFKTLAEINEVENGKYNGLFSAAPQYDFSDDLVRRLNSLENVYRYTGGKVFYEVRIKHFGDDLTTWDETKVEHAGDIEESYGKDAAARSQNYLGRYGIVRNNWYDLNVEIITKLGDPQDPAKWDETWPNKPNDNKDQYMAVIMRVLSWAKRTQSVKF